MEWIVGSGFVNAKQTMENWMDYGNAGKGGRFLFGQKRNWEFLQVVKNGPSRE
jgi:hypothetical protein